MVGGQMATEDINNATSILPDYEIVLLINDTKVSQEKVTGMCEHKFETRGPEDLSTGSKGYHAMVGGQMATEDINNAKSILPGYEIVLLINDTKDLNTGSKGYHAMIGGQMATEDINNAKSILPDYEIVLLINDTKDLSTGTKGYHAMVGGQMATEDINNAKSILPDYEIVLLVSDTKESTAVALNGLYEMFYTPPVRIGMIGPVLSFITVEIAAVTGLWQFVQVSGAATSPALADRNKYPTFFRTVASAAKLNLGYLEILKEMDWKTVAILTESREPHLSVSQDLQSNLEDNGIRVAIAKTFATDISDTIRLIKLKGHRCTDYLRKFYEGSAYRVFCQAFKQGLYGVKYVWFIKGLFQKEWWLKYEGTDSCSPEEVKTASNGYFCATYSVFGRTETPAATGITPGEFRKSASARINYNFTMDGQEYLGIGYDAMLALALALNASQKELPKGALENYRYGDTETTESIKKNLYGLDFHGVSGHVTFSDDGGRNSDFLLKQNRGGVEEIIGTFDPLNGSVSWYYSTELTWKLHGGSPPRETDSMDVTTVHIPRTIFIPITVFCGLGYIFACSFLCFNILKRNESFRSRCFYFVNRAIKMSSPNLNNVIAFGVIVAYTCIILIGIDVSLVDEDKLLKICKVRTWLIAMAFTLVFGGMFTKMWRVYSIVIHNRTKRKVIKDSHLVFIVGVLLLIDMLILVLHEITDSYQITNVRTQIPQTEEDLAKYVQRVHLHVQCNSGSENDLLWLLAFVIYKVFVMIFGVFLTWQTRNINVPALNDSYYVGLAIYNTILCFAVAVPLSIINNQSVGINYALVSCLVLFCVTTTLSMLFIPKLRMIYGKKNAVGDLNTINRHLTIHQPTQQVLDANQAFDKQEGRISTFIADKPSSNKKSTQVKLKEPSNETGEGSSTTRT
ncbi:gamma-aminobutyric acid type B receptor subunit 2-like [Amphiura filiformis]|uniref:gamma-aminobutyric acid type B receptor subunit 2-like n=1 Tax=Amphiura filiformis TaxID=82378 RepID=UPI003B21CE66